MNLTTLNELLGQVGDDDWQALIDGEGLLLVDDLSLEVGPASAPNRLLTAALFASTDAAGLRQAALAGAARLLEDYYRTHPLTPRGFNQQAARLIERHGAAAFVAPEGRLPPRTLFVDGGEVIAEAADSPRHRYGVFCETPHPLADSALAEQVRKWLERGAAHQHYLGMNVCRYNC